MSGENPTVAEIKRITESLSYGDWKQPREAHGWNRAAAQLGEALRTLRSVSHPVQNRDVVKTKQVIESVEAKLAEVKASLGQ